MKTWMTVMVLIVGLALPGPALADDEGGPCSTRKIAGRWLFATEVGQINSVDPPLVGDITAIGTVNIDRDGNVSGEFDATVAELVFIPNVPYWGSVTVDPDCTGTLTFETGAGSVRTDSIVVLSNKEYWGMSQDPFNLWTYRARRIAGGQRR